MILSRITPLEAFVALTGADGDYKQAVSLNASHLYEWQHCQIVGNALRALTTAAHRKIECSSRVMTSRIVKTLRIG